MLFNSFNFLIFFPLVTLIYFLLPHRFRWIHLLTASCVFYMFFIPIYISILAITILIDYFAALYIEKNEGTKRKRGLIVSIISTCAVLFVFKYFNFFNTNFKALADWLDMRYPVPMVEIILPIGLSFHTFQSLSYVIEVYRGNQKAEKHFGIYSLYVMFYPQLVAGPIERPQNLLHQFYEEHRFDYTNAVEGLKLAAWGMFKKIVIADRLSIYVNAVYNNQAHHSGKSLLLATVFFAIQIYCDFSGYSDVAIGVARVMGFKLMTNFNRPYFARSIAEFWKRWHISLSTWFKDYLYIPLGGNRAGNLRKYFNLFFTFLISGLWHGANWTYVFWGALNGIYLITPLIVTDNIKGIRKVHHWTLDIFHILTTFVLTLFAWIFFRSNSIGDGFAIIRKIGEFKGFLFTGWKSDFIYSLVFPAVLFVVEVIQEFKLFNGFSLYKCENNYIRRATYVILVITILTFGVFDGSQFIYFQF